MTDRRNITRNALVTFLKCASFLIVMDTYVITTALVEFNGKYLIAKRASTKKFSPSQWEFISGFKEEKEPAENTIVRELHEEVKLKGKIIRKANPFSFVDKEACWVVIPFLIKAKNDKAVINKKDHSESKWINIDELEKYKDLIPFSKMRELLL